MSFPLQSKTEDSSNIYRSDDLSDPALKSKTLSCNPAVTKMINECRKKITNHTCCFSNGEPDLLSRLMETILFRSYKVLPKNSRSDPEIGIFPRLPVKKVLKLSWIFLNLLRHEQSPYLLVLALMVLHEPHVALEPIGGGEGTPDQL